MENQTQQTLKTILDGMRDLTSTETILGEKYEHGDYTIVPVAKFSMGFGAGGGGSDEESGSGGGGGLKMEPVAFIVVTKDDVQLLPMQKKTFGSIIEAIPDVMTKITEMKKAKKEAKDEEK